MHLRACCRHQTSSASHTPTADLLLLGAIGLPGLPLAGGFAYLCVSGPAVPQLATPPPHDHALTRAFSHAASSHPRAFLKRAWRSVVCSRGPACKVATSSSVPAPCSPPGPTPPSALLMLASRSQSRRRRRRPGGQGRAGRHCQVQEVAGDAPAGRPRADAGSEGAPTTRPAGVRGWRRRGGW